MSLMIQRYMVCDRCHRDIEVPVGVSFDEAARTRAGWKILDGERALCPDCSRGYETLLARHRVEEEDYVTGRGMLR
ncbi:MAG: hypothetical protein Q4B91_03485 [Atopobiaceae bacterium]|nr:hypothetical protein [Atopobiaceae bacterium]